MANIRRLANSTKREVGIITRQTDGRVISPDDMTFSSSGSSETEDDRQQRQRTKPSFCTTTSNNNSSNSSKNNVKKMKTASNSAGSGARHSLLTVGDAFATTDDLGNQSSSDYFDDNFPSLKHAISRLSTAASLGSDSDSMRDDDFDDEDLAVDNNNNNDDAANNNNNKNDTNRFARFEIGGDHATIGHQQSSSLENNNNSSLVDEMTNMRMNAIERRMILSQDITDPTIAGPLPSPGKRGSLTLTPKQKCMSVSNVSAMEQQIAYGCPIETNDAFENFHSDSVRLAQPRKSAIDVCRRQTNNNIISSSCCDDSAIRSVSCYPGSFIDDGAPNDAVIASPAGSLNANNQSPVQKMAIRPERKKSYTSVTLSVPKILFS